MKKLLIITLLIGHLALLASSCAESYARSNEDLEKQEYAAEKNPVEVMVLQESTFKSQLVGNGKLRAFQKCGILFEASGQVASIMVKNGIRVGANSVIAKLENNEAMRNLDQAEISFKKAKLDRFELLVGQGFDPENIDSISPKNLETANIRSGYSSAKNSYDAAKLELSKHTLLAPFSGKVANLEAKKYEHISGGKEFCLLIDDSSFEVEFSVLETELKEIKQGLDVRVKPFSSGQEYLGKISEINPMIDENGMVKVKALIKNTGGLIEGMNVKLLIEKEIPNQLVVPKSAVLLRQDKEVLFRVKNGKAYWTYIHKIHENGTHCAVIANTERAADLNVGDTVIVKGNLNLAHESEVEVSSPQPSVGSQ